MTEAGPWTAADREPRGLTGPCRSLATALQTPRPDDHHPLARAQRYGLGLGRVSPRSGIAVQWNIVMKVDRDDLDRFVLEGIRDSGFALLTDGPGAGAARAAETLARAVGALEVRVFLVEGEDSVSFSKGAAEETPLDRFLGEMLTPERIEEWNRMGTEVEPVLVSLEEETSTGVAGELREAGVGSVLVVPFPGTAGVRGVMGAALPKDGVPDGCRLAAAAVVAQLAGIGIDVLGRALAAEETEGRLRRFIEQLPDPALLLDPSGLVREASEMVEPLFGLPAGSLAGRLLGPILREGEGERLLESLREAVESGATRAVFAVDGRRKGESRRIELNVRRFSEHRLLAVARDVTLQFRREHSLRVLLKHAPGMMASRNAVELWERLSGAVKELLPDATYVWVYRGEGDRVRVVWSSNPDAPPWEFRLRGWGTDVSGMLRQEEVRGEFLRRYGADERVARETLSAILEGHGTPMLLDHPTEQLAIYLSERELEQILGMWGESPPGQLIHCPVIVKGHMELLVVVDAPPGERPFSPEDAAFVWQLTNLAHQALGRIEGFDLARHQLRELETFLEAVRQVGEARGGHELMEVLVRRAMDALEADRARLLLVTDSGWRCVLSFGEGGPAKDSPVVVPGFPDDDEKVPGGVFLSDAGMDEAWHALAGEGTRSLMAMPLVSMGRFQGALLLAAGRHWEFTTGERQLARFFSDEIALVAAQVRLAETVIEMTASLHSVMDAVRVGIVLCDRETRLVQINRSAASLFRIQWPASIEGSVIELFPPDARRNVAEVLERTFADGVLGSVVFEIRGTIVQAEVHPRAEGGAILVFSGPDRAGLESVPWETSAEGSRSRAELGRIAVQWERVEASASHLNDLLTAMAGHLELAASRGKTVPDEAIALVDEACRTGIELGTLLGGARPDRRGGASSDGSPEID